MLKTSQNEIPGRFTFIVSRLFQCCSRRIILHFRNKKKSQRTSLVSKMGDLGCWLNYRPETRGRSLLNVQVHCHETAAIHHCHTIFFRTLYYTSTKCATHDPSGAEILHIESSIQRPSEWKIGTVGYVVVKKKTILTFLELRIFYLSRDRD